MGAEDNSNNPDKRARASHRRAPVSARQGERAGWAVYQTVYYLLRELRSESASGVFRAKQSPLKFAGFSVKSLVALPGIEPGF